MNESTLNNKKQKINVSFMNDKKRLFLLIMMSIVLCSSLFMSLFTPLPQALMLVIYGLGQGIVGLLLGLIFVTVLSYFVIQSPLIIGLYLISMVIALILVVIVKKRIHPSKGLVVGGLILTSIIALCCFSFLSSINTDITTYTEKLIRPYTQEMLSQNQEFWKQNSEDVKLLINKLQNPRILAEEFLETLPATTIISIFFVLWVNLSLFLRSLRLLNIGSLIKYSEYHLLNFKVKDWLVWPLILVLAIYLIGEESVGLKTMFLAKNSLNILALFYFFEGFGIYLDFLSFIGIHGFIRSFFILFTVILGPWLISILGLFNLWINFRKYLIPKNHHQSEE